VPAAPGHDRPRSLPTPDTVVRRAVDLMVAAFLLTILFPLLTLVAATVKLTSKGPVLYRQVRAGRMGVPFTILKFRSMVSGADRSGPLVTSAGDPRVTRIGKLLRAAKLDELPQLVNVLRGEMTLIGPRPEVPRYLRFYDEEELAVLTVRPGLTCSGQIFYTQVQQSGGDGAGDPEDRYVMLELHPKLALDLQYLRHRGLWSDLGILFRTVALLLGSRRVEAVPAMAESAQPF
jgi:lipopolysaccharide/colanic/teichoic acid biosynthesis glycosyltransferase